MIANQILSNIIKVMVIFLIAVVVLGIILVFLIIPRVIRGEVIEVPNVIGKSLAESINILQSKQLNAKIDSHKASPTIPEEHVLEQIPPPGFKVKRDKSIRLVLSSGADKIEVPDLTGKLLGNVKSVLQSTGFKMGITATVYSDNYPAEDTIITQTPLPKSIAPRGAKINLLLSGGVRRKLMLMPDLKGMKLNEVREELESNGLEIGLTFKPHPTLGDGVILAHEPPANQIIRVGQKIELEVSGSKAVAIRARPVRIKYIVTPGGDQQKHVRIIVKDSRGAKQLVYGFFSPGEKITRFHSVEGEAVMIVYEDDMEHPVLEKELY